MAIPYAQKLKDPRWQRKRLEALNRAEFRCEACQDTESTLHVHHKAYFKGREPWEYDVEQLAVLCENCHAYEHDAGDLYTMVGSYLPHDGPGDRNAAAFLLLGFSPYTAFPETFHEEVHRRPETGPWALKMVYLGLLAAIVGNTLIGLADEDDIRKIALGIHKDPNRFCRFVVETLGKCPDFMSESFGDTFRAALTSTAAVASEP